MRFTLCLAIKATLMHSQKGTGRTSKPAEGRSRYIGEREIAHFRYDSTMWSSGDSDAFRCTLGNLDFFEFVHNADKRGKALLHSLVELFPETQHEPKYIIIAACFRSCSLNYLLKIKR